MTVAIPLFGERVSLHFSIAPELLVVAVEGRNVVSRMRFPMGASSLAEKKSKIISLGVDTLVCGGIDRATQDRLQRRGIHVIANVSGEAEDVLSDLLEDGEMNFEEIRSAIMHLNRRDQKRLIVEVVPAMWPKVCQDNSAVACLRELVDEATIKECRERHRNGCI